MEITFNSVPIRGCQENIAAKASQGNMERGLVMRWELCSSRPKPTAFVPLQDNSAKNSTEKLWNKAEIIWGCLVNQGKNCNFVTLWTCQLCKSAFSLVLFQTWRWGNSTACKCHHHVFLGDRAETKMTNGPLFPALCSPSGNIWISTVLCLEWLLWAY